MARTMAIVNQKGGVGKTAVTCQLAYTLAREGERVLVVDMDPQGNASAIMDAAPADGGLTVWDALWAVAQGEENVDVSGAIVDAGEEWAGVKVMASDAQLANLERDGATGRDYRLRKVLAGVADDFDFVLVDCPPSIGACTANALTAADEAVIVTTADSESFAGITGIMKSIADVREYTNPNLVLSPLGILVNRVREQFTDQRAWLEVLEDMHGAITNATRIPERQIVNKARTNRVPAPADEARDIDQVFAELAAQLRTEAKEGE